MCTDLLPKWETVVHVNRSPSRVEDGNDQHEHPREGSQDAVGKDGVFPIGIAFGERVVYISLTSQVSIPSCVISNGKCFLRKNGKRSGGQPLC